MPPQPDADESKRKDGKKRTKRDKEPASGKPSRERESSVKESKEPKERKDKKEKKDKRDKKDKKEKKERKDKRDKPIKAATQDDKGREYADQDAIGRGFETGGRERGLGQHRVEEKVVNLQPVEARSGKIDLGRAEVIIIDYSSDDTNGYLSEEGSHRYGSWLFAPNATLPGQMGRLAPPAASRSRSGSHRSRGRSPAS